MTDQLTPCDAGGKGSHTLWQLAGKLLCTPCYQAAKNLPTLRQLVQMRGARP
jgi:hypothetical protein